MTARQDYRIPLLVLTAVTVAAVTVSGWVQAASVPHWMSPACTTAALRAEANQLDWQRVLQAHVDVEHEALDPTATRAAYRNDLAAIPGPPSSVDLAVCR